MKEKGTILIVDDEADIILSIKLLLKQHYQTVLSETDPENIPRLLKKYEPDLVLLDMNFSKGRSDGAEGLGWLNFIKLQAPLTQVIIITAFSDVPVAVQAIKAGAAEFIEKPWRNEKLLSTVQSVMKLAHSQSQLATARNTQSAINQAMDQPFSEIIGASSAMQHVYKIMEKVAATDVNVLILGENGTGKEVIARALHRGSHRSGAVFLPVDLGAIPETLFESEMFGHKKGAFTDAREDRIGRFQAAQGGTLFLDEIGNVPLAMQSKLLQALQTHTITPVGSDKSISLNIRVICATNKNLNELTTQNLFREDLLYRINTVEIYLPPLRERGMDIDLLSDHFLKLYARKYNKGHIHLDESATKALRTYRWPGNIRELQHVMERAVILSEGESLGEKDFYLKTEKMAESSETHKIEDLPSISEQEKKLIQDALSKHEGNISRAAKALGITRAALYRRLEKFDL